MPYIVKVSAAKMPSSCKGRYVRIGVLEVEPGVQDVSRLSNHAWGVIRVVKTWENCHQGKTERCAASRARAQAAELCAELNAGEVEK